MTESDNFNSDYQFRGNWGAVILMEAIGDSVNDAADDIREYMPNQGVRCWAIKKLVRLDDEGNEIND